MDYWQTKCPREIRESIFNQFNMICARQFNWDDRNSKKPDEQSVANARNILDDLLDAVIENGYLWLTPHISSDEHGNITIEWHKDRHDLHFEIGKKEAEYIKVWGTNIEHEMQVEYLKRKDYIPLWQWLLSG